MKICTENFGLFQERRLTREARDKAFIRRPCTGSERFSMRNAFFVLLVPALSALASSAFAVEPCSADAAGTVIRIGVLYRAETIEGGLLLAGVQEVLDQHAVNSTDTAFRRPSMSCSKRNPRRSGYSHLEDTSPGSTMRLMRKTPDSIPVFFFMVSTGAIEWSTMTGAIVVGFGYPALLKTTIGRTKAGLSIGMADIYDD